MVKARPANKGWEVEIMISLKSYVAILSQEGQRNPSSFSQEAQLSLPLCLSPVPEGFASVTVAADVPRQPRGRLLLLQTVL